MNQPDIIIRAHIPNVNGDKFVIDTDTGDKPTMQFTAGKHRTYEDALNNIMQDVAKTYAKVDRRLPNEDGLENHVSYQTQALAETAITSIRHGWSA